MARRTTDIPRSVTHPAPEAQEMLSLAGDPDPKTLGRRVLALHGTFASRIIDPTKPELSKYHYAKALERLGHEIQHHTFANPKGSNPLPYASPDDLLFYARLKERADANVGIDGKPQPWPNATRIIHENSTRRFFELEFRKPDPTQRDANGTPIMGYRVGYLNAAAHETAVLFCSDGLLRMAIRYPSGHNHGQTYAGFSSLPDPEVMYPAITGGYGYAVDHKLNQSHTLRSAIRRVSGLDIDIAMGPQQQPGPVEPHYSPGRNYTNT